jgi:hypothetical protein
MLKHCTNKSEALKASTPIKFLHLEAVLSLRVSFAQIANRIKAKGLQKLRWYCQLCQKQCRDENGFKCHQMSESHRRQMEVFGQNPDRIVDGYSEEFEQSFVDHLKRA